jgi:CBS domain containing-hemolysin-like protein
MSESLGLVLTLVLLAGNGFFVAAEFALVAARRSIVEPQADAGVRGARSALHAMENISLMMAGAQLGVTVCSLALGALSEPALAHLLEPVFHAVHLSEGAVHPVAFVIALALVTVLHVVLGEVIPKNIALAGPERSALVLAPPLAAVVTAFKPLIWLLNAASNGILRLVGVTPRAEVTSAFTRDEVAAMVAESHREGRLDADEHELLTGAIDFVERSARDVLLGVDRLESVEPSTTADELEALAARTGFSRFPLVGLRGYLHVKDVLTCVVRDQPVPADLVRELPALPIDASVRSVLEVMRGRGTHVVRIDDGGGRPVGIVTMEDVLAGLIGAR